MEIQICPCCDVRVIPSPEGRCPSCQTLAFTISSEAVETVPSAEKPDASHDGPQYASDDEDVSGATSEPDTAPIQYIRIADEVLFARRLPIETVYYPASDYARGKLEVSSEGLWFLGSEGNFLISNITAIRETAPVKIDQVLVRCAAMNGMLIFLWWSAWLHSIHCNTLQFVLAAIAETAVLLSFPWKLLEVEYLNVSGGKECVYLAEPSIFTRFFDGTASLRGRLRRAICGESTNALSGGVSSRRGGGFRTLVILVIVCLSVLLPLGAALYRELSPSSSDPMRQPRHKKSVSFQSQAEPLLPTGTACNVFYVAIG